MSLNIAGLDAREAREEFLRLLARERESALEKTLFL